MIPNLYKENGCFTKHPFINGCLGFQVEVENGHIWKVTILLEGTIFHWTMTPSSSRGHGGKGGFQTLQFFRRFKALPSKVSNIWLNDGLASPPCSWGNTSTHSWWMFRPVMFVFGFRELEKWFQKTFQPQSHVPKKGFPKMLGFPNKPMGFSYETRSFWGVKWG